MTIENLVDLPEEVVGRFRLQDLSGVLLLACSMDYLVLIYVEIVAAFAVTMFVRAFEI